jgi:hypothetical protein
MNTNQITNSDDVIDSRDVIARIEELNELMLIGPDGDLPGTSEEIEELKEELKVLEELAQEGADYSSDWQYGSTLIRGSYFKEYAMELAEEIGAINPNATWPNNCIDWDRAERELRMDYSPIEFDGVTYWIR